jgi:hypothetical protein
MLSLVPASSALADEKPPLGCFANVRFQDDLPPGDIRADLGYGLRLSDGPSSTRPAATAASPWSCPMECKEARNRWRYRARAPTPGWITWATR